MAALPMVEATPVASARVSGNQIRVDMGRPTHHDDVADNRVAKRNIASNGDEQVDNASRANAATHNRNHAAGGVVANFVDDGKHL